MEENTGGKKMGVLAEFVRKEADLIRTELNRREEAKKEWLNAIARLTDQLRQWVADADGGLGLLEAVGGRSCILQEPALGVYSVTALSITVGGLHSGRAAEVVPRARYVTAVIKPAEQAARRADGMVEIRDRSMARYYLFRLRSEEGDRWFIRSVAAWNADPSDNTVEPLDRDRFEAAMLQVLQ